MLVCENWIYIQKYTEAWMSGLNQRFTKPSARKKAREFESHRLREYKNESDFGRAIFISRRRVHKLLCVRVRFERRSVKFLVKNFHESVTRPEFCDDKILSRGRNMRISIFAYWVLMVSPPPQIKSVLLRLIFVSI